tara:strand:+ start:81 stop:362 length:282 start_codon:yes stop_codon:yes gene_type:complete
MIMMGPKKDKGAMIVSIMEKFGKKKSSYEDGKKSNEEFMDKGGHDSAYNSYRAEVDAIFDSFKDDNKEKFARALKGFIQKCVSSMEKKDDDKY